MVKRHKRSGLNLGVQLCKIGMRGHSLLFRTVIITVIGMTRQVADCFLTAKRANNVYGLLDTNLKRYINVEQISMHLYKDESFVEY
jgi:hypothetical protein